MNWTPLKRGNDKGSVQSENSLVLPHRLFLNVIFEKSGLDKLNLWLNTRAQAHTHPHPFVVVLSVDDAVGASPRVSF